MFEQWRRQRALQRVKPGDGAPLKPYRWWQPTLRSLMHLDREDGRWTVDVRYLSSDENGYVRSSLYRDGLRAAEARLPAAYPIPGGVVEVDASAFGLKRCRFLADDGSEHPLTPDPRSGEGRRATLERERPGLSRFIGAVSFVVLLGSLALLGLQLAEQLSGIPPVKEAIGRFRSPVQLSTGWNVALTLLAVAASTERALRLRYSALLDGGIG